MELEDFYLMQKGFFDKRKADEIRFAKVAFYINAIGENLAGNPAHGEKFIREWLGEKPKTTSEEDRKKLGDAIKSKIELANKIAAEYDKKFGDRKKKKKNARTAKNNN